MHAQVRFERSLVVLFRLPRALMLVLLAAAILALPSGRRCPELTPEQAAKAMNDTRAYLHSGPRRPDPGHHGPVREAGRALGTDQTSSDSDESARPRLFGMLADVACPNIEHGELMWHYLDDRRTDFGPYTETQMRKWWIEGERFHPDTMVRIVSVEHHVKLHDIYPMGNPPTWKPTTSLSRSRRDPEYNVQGRCTSSR